MKKGIFIVYSNFTGENNTGIQKKIDLQIAALNENGLQCEKHIVDIKDNDVATKLFSRLPFTNVAPTWKWNQIYENIDFIYFRRPHFINGYLIKILKKIKKKNPFCKIVLEIPTYPYDKEIVYRSKCSFLNFPFLIKDRFWRKRLKKAVDCVTFVNDGYTEWCGLKVITISNGIRVDDYPLKKQSNYRTNVINLIAVAFFKEWHGYERLLFGLADYLQKEKNGKYKVNIHFVGDGSELDRYKTIVDDNNLQKYVFFHGLLTGDQLDEMYDCCDFGLCSFGAYKKNIFLSKELKSREYLSRGLPIISGVHLDVFDKGFKYYLEFENNDSVVDFDKIINFYELLKEKGLSSINIETREFAMNELNYKKCFESVIDFFNS